jgi:hypothetical protein
MNSARERFGYSCYFCDDYLFDLKSVIFQTHASVYATSNPTIPSNHTSILLSHINIINRSRGRSSRCSIRRSTMLSIPITIILRPPILIPTTQLAIPFPQPLSTEAETHISLSKSSWVLLGLSFFPPPPPPLLPSPPQFPPRLSLPPSRPPPPLGASLLSLLLGAGLVLLLLLNLPPLPPGTYLSTPSGGGFLVFVLLLGLRLLSLSRSLLPPASPPPLLPAPGSSILSNKLRPGFTAVSKGFLAPVPAAGPLRAPDGAEGTSARRIGWPLALAPSYSRMAVRACVTEE